MLIPCISSFHMRSAFSLWSTNGGKFFQPALDTRTVSEGEVVKKVLAGSLVTCELALWANLIWSTSWNFETLSQNRSSDNSCFFWCFVIIHIEGVLGVESSCGKCQSWLAKTDSDESEDDALAGVPLPISWEAIRCKIGRCRFAYESLSVSLCGFYPIFSQYKSLVYIYIHMVTPKTCKYIYIYIHFYLYVA